MSPVLVSSGTGPVEVRRFVAALADALAGRFGGTARCDHGEPEAPRSVLLELASFDALLVGTHALVDRSRGRGRKRWFAGVRVLPEVRAPAVLREEDVVLTACRSGGAGGQHVNTTSSAVLAHHLPSGLRVRSEAERSQHRNRAVALERLARALAALEEDRRGQDARETWLSHHRLVRGAPVAEWTLETLATFGRGHA